MTNATPSNEIRLTRIYDAPVSVVWDAWTDPAQVEQWWGPRGFTLTTHSKDLRPGGKWIYTMHGPDGTDYLNVTPYYEVVKESRLVYDHGGGEDRPPLFRVTVQFTDLKGKTKMEFKAVMATAEVAAEMRKFIKKAGGDGTWDRLGEYLVKKLSGKEHFIINRAFDAPIDTVFQMWTDPKHFSQWLPPTGFTMEFRRAEIKPGGKAVYSMSSEDGTMTMFGRVEYLKIEKPGFIVYTQQFCDANENISRHPKAPTWPETMLTTVQLAAEGADRTRVTVTWEPHGKVTREELEAFVNARAGMTQGWTGSFDKLEARLADTVRTAGHLV
ncbi:MAG: SRPBCC domain-containing protein [Planctomycetes bacterium]|nr:SRPBCC domain-containing protein [Planctomycetota bacterium]